MFLDSPYFALPSRLRHKILPPVQLNVAVIHALCACDGYGKNKLHHASYASYVIPSLARCTHKEGIHDDRPKMNDIAARCVGSLFFLLMCVSPHLLVYLLAFDEGWRDRSSRYISLFLWLPSLEHLLSRLCPPAIRLMETHFFLWWSAYSYYFRTTDPTARGLTVGHMFVSPPLGTHMFGEGPLSVMSLSVSRQTVSAILLCLLLLPPYHEIPLMGTCGWMDGSMMTA